MGRWGGGGRGGGVGLGGTRVSFQSTHTVKACKGGTHNSNLLPIFSKTRLNYLNNLA